KKSETESFVRTFANLYTPIVTISALLLIIIPTLIYGEFDKWFYRALVFLVISCPCAFVISVPLTYFAGIGKCAKKGIIVKGSNFLEEATKISKIYFDKTGTLTKGNFKVEKVNIKDEYYNEKIFKIISSMESLSYHPIAKAINEHFKLRVDTSEISDFIEINGKGIKGNYGENQLIIGTRKFLNENNILFDFNEELGTIIHIAYNSNYIGNIVINDEIKAQASKVIQKIKEDFNLESIMITGDKEEISRYVANKIGIDRVYAELLPEDKLNILNKEIALNEKITFVGDGVNDAPSMASANLGISMGDKGADISIEISDIILMNDNLESIYKFFYISKITKKIVWQNIILSLGVKFSFLFFALFGLTNLHFAVLADVGLTLVAILNAMRLLYVKV
ncbi:heavy metal translocating P-type ATPase, partial [Helcococcus ovis]|uniref:heavy metal translocating P-type ATPase n=1 Tax=Helcococcus ovis TaxID=72026 RepID=UPI0038BD6168